jgi:death-on-curing protein
MNQTRFLNVVELMIINEEVIGQQSQLRDVDLLESAVLRPQSSAFGQDAYPTVIDKAAALFHSLSRNHAFVDGNKRTSLVALLMFLRLNGYRANWDREQALAMILEIATGAHDVQSIADWLRQNVQPLPESSPASTSVGDRQ